MVILMTERRGNTDTTAATAAAARARGRDRLRKAAKLLANAPETVLDSYSRAAVVRAGEQALEHIGRERSAGA